MPPPPPPPPPTHTHTHTPHTHTHTHHGQNVRLFADDILRCIFVNMIIKYMIDPIQWRICAALWEVELSWYYLAWMSNSITLCYADAINYPCYILGVGLVNILKYKRPHWLICSWNKGSVTFKTTLKACSWLRRIRPWQKFTIISTSADPFLQWFFASRDHKLLTAWFTKQRPLSHIICYVFDDLRQRSNLNT